MTTTSQSYELKRHLEERAGERGEGRRQVPS